MKGGEGPYTGWPHAVGVGPAVPVQGNGDSYEIYQPNFNSIDGSESLTPSDSDSSEYYLPM